MTPWGTVAIFMIPYTLLLIGLGLTVLTDTYISRIHKTIMLSIVVLTASLIVQNVADYFLTDTPHILLRKIVGIYGYSIRPAIIVLFYYFVDNGKKTVPAWCLVGFNAALYLTALFSPVTFDFGRTNYAFVRGPLGYTCHLVGAILLCGLFLLVISEYRTRKREIIFPFVGMLFISGGVLVDSLLPIDRIVPLSALTMAVVISCIFVYFWLHIQFVRQHETDLLAEQRIKIMVSQIQPHFLYNTIATFRALCKRDPDKAAQVAEKFGQYLRQNLDSLDTENLIPFEKEIEHTKIYADIEMVRFENVSVVYDLPDKAFSLPPLTVQPIVENAIRHGVRIRKEGVVWVNTRPAGNGHEIIIRDNGIGFDVHKRESADGKHIGIQNVKERIEKLCGGTLTLESKPGVGTTVTIWIPERGVKK